MTREQIYNKAKELYGDNVFASYPEDVNDFDMFCRYFPVPMLIQACLDDSIKLLLDKLNK